METNSNERDLESSGLFQSQDAPRLLSDSTINKISETLGVLNHVGHFLVDMTRGGPAEPTSTTPSAPSITPPSVDEDLPTNQISSTTEKSSFVLKNNKPNTLLQDIPKKIEKNRTIIQPIIMRKEFNLQPVTTSSRPSIEQEIDRDISLGKEVDSPCKTPDGKNGRCEDLSSCPVLLLNLNGLRESLCFKSLFVPGVCCPLSQDVEITTTTKRPIEEYPTSTKRQNLVLIPQIEYSTTTKPTLLKPKPKPQPANISTDPFEIEECGQQEYTAGRIVGGIEAQNGQWPWMAAIFLHGPKKTEFWCGGSLIGERYILTAAHCTRDSRQRPFAARQFTVRLGDIDLSTDEEPSEPVTFAVKEVRAHDKFVTNLFIWNQNSRFLFFQIFKNWVLQ